MTAHFPTPASYAITRRRRLHYHLFLAVLPIFATFNVPSINTSSPPRHSGMTVASRAAPQLARMVGDGPSGPS
ncbi:hypothetical protein SODALDRAFT_329351, partial [Sodiomyces alkalinus F11]